MREYLYIITMLAMNIAAILFMFFVFGFFEGLIAFFILINTIVIGRLVNTDEFQEFAEFIDKFKGK